MQQVAYEVQHMRKNAIKNVQPIRLLRVNLAAVGNLHKIPAKNPGRLERSW